MPALHLFRRTNSPADLSSSTLTINSPIIIVGITIIGLIFLGICLWLGFRICRQRAAAKRESKMGAAFLSVKGLVTDDGSGNDKGIVLTSVYMRS